MVFSRVVIASGVAALALAVGGCKSGSAASATYDPGPGVGTAPPAGHRNAVPPSGAPPVSAARLPGA